MQETLYFTDLMQRRVHDSAGRPVGTVLDLVVSSGELFPRITGFVVTPFRSAGGSSSRLFVPLEHVEDPTAAPLILKPGAPEPEPLHLEAGEARLGHTFLDKQIVDTQGVRVVRVNDLSLAHVERELRLLGADVGLTGLLRRMHSERAVRWLARPLNAHFTDTVIPWNFVDPLSTDKVQLNVTRGRIHAMRPADLADVLEQLPVTQRSEVLADMSDEQVADAISEARLDVQRSIIGQMEDERASDILERMAPDDATDLLQDLEAGRREDLLERMDVEDRQELTELLAYRADTAGGLMTTDVVRIPADFTAEGAIAFLRNLAPDTETVYYLYIVDDAGKLEGVVSLRGLITAAPSTPIRKLLNPRVHTVRVDDDQEEVAETIARYNLLAVPVVDEEGVLKGIVTIDDVIDVMKEEASEDLALLSGGSPTGAEGSAAPFSLGRMGWMLLVLLAAIGIGLGALRVTPGPLNALQAAPESRIMVFLLIPLLLDVANTLAFQTSNVAIRALMEDVPGRFTWRPFRDEITASGGMAVLAALVGLILCFLWPHLGLAARLALPASLFGAYLYAIVCGAGFPFLLSRLGREPNRGVRPLLIVIVSGGGLAIYFGLLWALGVV